MSNSETKPTRSTDLQALHSQINGLVGRTCWKVAYTYAGELSLHFGRRLAYRNPKMAGKKTGQWRLDTRATPWTGFTPNGVISSKERETKGEKTVEKELKVFEGEKVTNITVSVPDRVLTVVFGKDLLFRVTPTANSTKSGLSYWKLFMPDHKLVTFGPGDFWESLMRQTGTRSPEEAARDLQRLAGIKSNK